MSADKARVQRYVSKFCSLLDDLIDAYHRVPNNDALNRKLATRSLFLACKLGLVEEERLEWQGMTLFAPLGWSSFDLDLHSHDQRWVQQQLEYREEREKRIRDFQAKAMALPDQNLAIEVVSAVDRSNLAEDVKEFCGYLEHIIEIYEMPHNNPEIHRFGKRANRLALRLGLMCQDRLLALKCYVPGSDAKIPYVEEDWWSLRAFGKLQAHPVDQWRTWQKRAQALLRRSETQRTPGSPRAESGPRRVESGVFLSHSHADGTFARKLANDLKAAGARVWIDEAEIEIGDSLIEKIREGIDVTDYLVVVLSPDSVQSEWVRREVEIAMHQEIEGKKVKVLPVLHRRCDLPGFLKGKFYADFTDVRNYSSALGRLLRRLTRGDSVRKTLDD